MYCNGVVVNILLFMSLPMVMDLSMVNSQAMRDSSLTFEDQLPQFHRLPALQPLLQKKLKPQLLHSRQQENQRNNQNPEQPQSEIWLDKLKKKAIDNQLESLNGHLYDLFKRRLDTVQKELTYHKLNKDKKKTPSFYQTNPRTCKGLPGRQQQSLTHASNDRSVIAYDEGADNGRDDKRSSMKDNFSEEYKKRVDKVENGLRKEENSLIADRPGRSFFNWLKNNSIAKGRNLTAEIKTGKKKQKTFIGEIATNPARFDKTLYDFANSNTIKDSLFEEYRKQIDVINNALQALDKRANRNADPYLKGIPLPSQTWLTTKNDQHTQPDNNLIWTKFSMPGIKVEREIQHEAQTDSEDGDEMNDQDEDYSYSQPYGNAGTFKNFHPLQGDKWLKTKDYQKPTKMDHTSVWPKNELYGDENLEDLDDIDDRTISSSFYDDGGGDRTETVKVCLTADDFREEEPIDIENKRIKDVQGESNDDIDYGMDPQNGPAEEWNDVGSETYRTLHNFEETYPNDQHSEMDSDSAWTGNRYFGPARLSKNLRKSKETADDSTITRIDRTPQILEQVHPLDLKSWLKTNNIEYTQLDDDNSDWIKKNEVGTNLRRRCKSLAPTTAGNIVGGRAILSNTSGMLGATNNSLYPSVLTKAVEISLNPSNNANSGNLLANVAKKMNTSTLDLAEKIASSRDVNPYALSSGGHLNKVIESYMSKTVVAPRPFSATLSPIMSAATQSLAVTSNPSYHIVPTIANKIATTAPATVAKQQVINNIITSTAASLIHDSYVAATVGHIRENNEYSSEGDSGNVANLSAILDRVLTKLEKMQMGKSSDDDETEHPDGAPCDLVGSWTSQILGLCFDIHLNGQKNRDFENKNKDLNIELQECVPPKVHNIIDLDWKFGGSGLKQIGGPFYLHAEKRVENLAATFLGFCRTCGGIDTIYGSWTFLLPSKDCSDTSLAFDVKRDIIRRSRLESKRKERYKNLYYRVQNANTKH